MRFLGMGIFFCSIVLGSCGKGESQTAKPSAPPQIPSATVESQAVTQADGFYDITKETGITFIHTDGSSGRYYIVETVTAGLGVFDYDNDGDLDIYFVNGAALPGRTFDVPPTNELWRNDGNMKFTNVTQEAGVGDTGYGMGCAMGDTNNDGFMDIYVSNFGDDVFYKNNGDGTFTDATKQAGLGDPRLGAGTVMADFNKDGHLDIFEANYVECSLVQAATCTIQGVSTYCDPSTWDMYEPQEASLYLNNGDGTFRNASESSGITMARGRGMGVSSSDFDRDGDTDIFIANDVTENFMWQNRGDGTFEQVGLYAGVSFDLHGQEHGSMGCDFGDFNGDGWFDIIVTSYQGQPNSLFRNNQDGTFDDVTIPAGAIGRMVTVGWACPFFDYDNDGDFDLFIANGHLQDNVEKIMPNVKYFQTNQLYRNNGDGTFTDSSAEAGPGLQAALSSRGGVMGDLDNDGDLDIVISNSRREPTILRNELHNGNHWINIKLQGTKSNHNGIGSRVEVTANGKTQVNEVRAGSCFQSHYDLRLHFGLGQAEKIDSITVIWPSGQVDTLTDVPPNQFVLIREGTGQFTKQF